MNQDIALENYYYSGQLRSHILQFMAIFSGLKVAHGKNDFDSTTNLQNVSIFYGSKDRVVAHILSENTQNKMVRLPAMSVQLMGLEIARERLTGQGITKRDVRLPRGGAIPDDLQVIERLQSIPYTANMELSIHTSNTDQQFQILEQILLLFNPSLQIQVSDKFGNRQMLVEVFLETISPEENYPAGTDPRLINTNISFTYVFYLTPPTSLSDDVIHKIKVRLQAVSEIDDNPSILNEGIDPFVISTIGAPPN